MRSLDCDRSSGRSRIGTLKQLADALGFKLRSFFGAIEDWNPPVATCRVGSGKLRSFFGAIEDWNPVVRILIAIAGKDCDRSSGRSRIGTVQFSPKHWVTRWIAIVLRGDRGLEPDKPPKPDKDPRYCDRSSGRSRIGT